MLRQTERAQQAKLAALKEWSHIDACKADSIETLNDNLLYNLVRDDYEAFKSSNSAKKRKCDDFGEARDEAEEMAADSAEDSGYDSDVQPSQRRKRSSRSTTSHSLGHSDKKHNLRELADSKQAGRILFMFEKISKSRL